MSDANVGGSSAAALSSVPEELKDTVTLSTVNGAIEALTRLIDPIANLARANSVWPLTFGTSCCAIEMMSVVCPSSTSRDSVPKFSEVRPGKLI